VPPGRDRDEERGLAAPAQVAPLQVDRGAGRFAVDAEQRHARLDLLEPPLRRAALVLVRLGGDVLRVVPVGLLVAAQRLVRAGDVEDDVPVGSEAVRGEELDQRLVVLAGLEELVAAVEAGVRLVGAGVGARRWRGQQEDRGEGERDDERQVGNAHRRWLSVLL
jgi:hypothetical protein